MTKAPSDSKGKIMWVSRQSLLTRIPQPMQDILKTYQQDIPVRVVTLAKKELKIDVQLSTLASNISGEIKQSIDPNYSALMRINRYDSEQRRRFTIAHEIGHFLLHNDKISGEGIQDSVLYRSNISDALEVEANQFAADLLMPAPLLKSYIFENKLDPRINLEDVAEKFNVSAAAMRARLGVYQ